MFFAILDYPVILLCYANKLCEKQLQRSDVPSYDTGQWYFFQYHSLHIFLGQTNRVLCFSVGVTLAANRLTQ